jgi:three-Cys-motif partner protein
LRNQKWCRGFYYIDAFAGGGQHAVRSKSSEQELSQLLLNVSDYGQRQEEQQTYLKGSPQVALELQHPFDAYVFIEKNPDRVKSLKALEAEYGSERTIRIIQEDCTNYLLNSVVNNPKIDWNHHRAVVFLDPFGMQVTWATLEALASTKAIEVFLNFPVGMAIQRLLLRDQTKFTDERREKLDTYFGSPGWFPTLYKKEKTLFGEETEKIEQSGKALVKWYRKRLRKAFGHASKAALILNTKGAHLYYLLLASPKPTGVKIADYILSAGEWV